MVVLSTEPIGLGPFRFEIGELFKVRMDRAYNASVSKDEMGKIKGVTHKCPLKFCGSFESLMSNPSECPFPFPVVYIGMMKRRGNEWYFRDCDILKLLDQNDIGWYKSPLVIEGSCP